MANKEHLDILEKGVKAWNEWQHERDAIRALRKWDPHGKEPGDTDLSGAALCGANLSWANLVRANLSDADLSGADLCGASLTGANLSRANLTSANASGAYFAASDLTRSNLSRVHLTSASLFRANLAHADLSGADLSQAILSFTNLSGANLFRAQFGKAIFEETVLVDLDLSTATDLEQARHQGPSFIGIETLYRSKGKIPESFLRGAGVPENFIEYMHSLTGAAFVFYSCFISYSTKDQDFADRLYADLQAKGVRCWFAPHDIQGGRKLHEQIDEAIRVYDKLLLILSDASMNSPWVKTEIANARTKEAQQKRQMLFPITVVPFDRIREWKLFDADRGIDSAREIREYFIPDFSNWKDHDSYQKAFDRLVRDLKAEGKDKATA